MKMHHRLIAVEQESQAGEQVTCEWARQTRQGEVCLVRQHETETCPRDNPAELQGSNYITDQIRAAYIICALKFSMFRQSTSRLALGCFRTNLRWGEERNKQQQQQRRGWLSLLLSLLFPRLPVIRVLFPSGPQCFPLDQPVSAYNHYYILLVPDIPLFRYGTAFALLSITPAMSKWAQCFTSTNSFNYKLLLHIYFTTANKQTTYVRKG